MKQPAHPVFERDPDLDRRHPRIEGTFVSGHYGRTPSRYLAMGSYEFIPEIREEEDRVEGRLRAPLHGDETEAAYTGSRPAYAQLPAGVTVNRALVHLLRLKPELLEVVYLKAQRRFGHLHALPSVVEEALRRGVRPQRFQSARKTLRKHEETCEIARRLLQLIAVH